MIRVTESVSEPMYSRTTRPPLRNLVAQIADGQEPDPDDVAGILADAVQTVDDLRASVDLLLRRRSLRHVYDQLPALTKERAEIEKRIATANAILEKAEQTHEATTYPLFGRLNQIKHAVADADRARAALVESCDDADLLDQLADVRLRFTDACNRRSALQQECSSLRDWISTDREAASRERPTRAQELTEQAERREARLRQFEAEIEELERQIPEIERQESEIRQRMLEP
jgi:chromosome segregation ATPase